jgi:RHS repeat-associated protein
MATAPPPSSTTNYGYRFYHPELQKWPNRDPLGEPGFELLRQVGEDVESTGPNLYAFVRNDPVNQFDPLGLKEKKEKSYWDWVKEMADKVKKAAKNYEDGKCPKDPCKLPSSLNALCTCMYGAAKNKSVEDMIQCVCLTSPDSECDKKVRKAIESVYGGK